MIRELSPNHLYLTATGRLARRLRHEYRMACLSDGSKAWESLRAFSLNDWLEQFWSGAWPEEILAHRYRRLGILMDIVSDIPPPAPLPTDVNLCGLLDDTFAVLFRHGLDPSSGLPSTPLVEWRRKILKHFRESMASTGHFHPAELPERIARSVQEGTLPCPDSVVIAGFDSPAPVEMNLFHVLNRKTSFSTMKFPDRKPDVLEAFSLPSPEQEILYLVQRLVEDAGTVPLHRIGVVVPDLESYADFIEFGLESVSPEKTGADTAWFNISLGKTVLSFPLIQAALLPLRLSTEEVTREGLLAFLTSPYYALGKSYHLSRADLLWRRSYIDNGFAQLMNALRTGSPDVLESIESYKLESIVSFFEEDFSRERSLPQMLDRLQNLWTALGFPVISDEKDSIAVHHLMTILGNMKSHLKGRSMNGCGLLKWIQFLASCEIAQRAASEEAGIQVLGLIESRGHDFDRLYLVGMSDRSFPQPVRPLPLLDAAERRQVLGGTPESQYEFAEISYRRLLSSSPRVTLLRPEQAGQEPLAPSPFWPPGETKEYVDLWNAPGPVWIRAPWLQAAFDGMNVYQSNFEEPSNVLSFPDIVVSTKGKSGAVPLPDSLTVSELERALTCPALFFFEVITGLKPLPDPMACLFPVERGEKLHRVLSSFTRESRKKGLLPDPEDPDLLTLLAECVESVLKDRAVLPRWMVERNLWLDENGLLRNWLRHEEKKMKQDWTVAAEEIPFRDLRIRDFPFTLRGRIDRVDLHPELGIICWDYKSGDHPGKKDILSSFTAPQLPLYVMALRRGAAGAIPTDRERIFRAGYLCLKSPSEIRETIIGDSDFDWEHLLNEWSELLGKLGSVLLRGDFIPQPYPFSRLNKAEKFCRSCPCLVLCEKGTIEDVMPDDGEDR